MTPQNISYGYKKRLLLYLFIAVQMRKEKAETANRVFLTHDDYITQDLRSKSVHWLTEDQHNCVAIHAECDMAARAEKTKIGVGAA